MTTSPKPGEPSWRYRRLLVYAVILWASYQLWVLIDRQDSRLNETIAFGWQVILATVVLGYLGFATAQDISAIMTTRTARPYADPPPPPTPAPEQTINVVQKNDDPQPPAGYAS